jgi:hypothetical protein
MWRKGEILVTETNRIYEYEAKVYGEPSEEYGIHGSNISKLWVREKGEKQACFNYDRGFNLLPIGENADEILSVVDIIIAKFKGEEENV